jgi:hypothetical protein
VTKLQNFFNSAAQLNHSNGFKAIILDRFALRYGKKLEMNVKGKIQINHLMSWSCKKVVFEGKLAAEGSAQQTVHTRALHIALLFSFLLLLCRWCDVMVVVVLQVQVHYSTELKSPGSVQCQLTTCNSYLKPQLTTIKAWVNLGNVL